VLQNHHHHYYHRLVLGVPGPSFWGLGVWVEGEDEDEWSWDWDRNWKVWVEGGISLAVDPLEREARLFQVDRKRREWKWEKGKKEKKEEKKGKVKK